LLKRIHNLLKREATSLYPIVFTIIFVFILFQYSFNTLESIFYDFNIRFDLGMSKPTPIVLITIDEESDEFLGEKYPYSYATHSKMVNKLLADEPSGINSFVQHAEPDSERDEFYLSKFKNELEAFMDKGGFFHFGTEIDTWNEQKPPKDLVPLGYSLALINIDNASFSKDDVCRRAILNISGENTLHLWTANRERNVRGLPSLATKDILGSYYLSEADATFTLFRYSTNPDLKKTEFTTIPFHRVVVGNFPADFFRNKLVLIGPSYISNSGDFVFTPHSKEESKGSKLAIHASIIDSLIQNRTVYQAPRWLSFVICIILAIILAISISNFKPTIGLLITIVAILTISLLSYILFSLLGIWLSIAHIVLTIFVVYYIWVPFRAIAEYQTRYKIQEETKLLKEVESLKQNFISLMSHDLKTPVAKIAGMADVLLQKTKNMPDIRDGIATILDSTKELNKFITSILDLTKIESQKITLNKSSKDINTILEAVVKSLFYEIQSKKIDVVLDCSPLYPIEMDTSLMTRVCSNLLENAIKYSPEGSQVKIKSWDDPAWVYVEIIDNGPGIASQDLKHVFDKFFRVKNDASHSIKGTGLGLYLVKYFVELHGGTIEVSSTLGIGSTFILKLKNA
jgi:signal transduction histidine kinase